MPIYFFAASVNAAEGKALQDRLLPSIPDLQKVETVEELSRRLPPEPQSSMGERTYVLFPFSHADATVDRLVEMAARGREILYFIFISDEISATDYKRLLRAGNADWVSSRGAPQEVLDILSRHQRAPIANETPARPKPAFVSFVPSGGGVGNSTIALEIGVQLRTSKAKAARAICLVDLDFQTSHVCDLLDIDPRLQIDELALYPERLDAQLFELFVSHHSSGLDVLAAARSKETAAEPSIAALDALFAKISEKYELVLVDLPVPWVTWTRQILGVSDLAVVTGLSTIPSLRQVADTVKAIRGLDPAPARIEVALNRCPTRLMGGLVGRQYAKRILEAEPMFCIREHASAARQSVNTGVPVSLAAPSNWISKDIAKMAALVSGLQATRPIAASK